MADKKKFGSIKHPVIGLKKLEIEHPSVAKDIRRRAKYGGKINNE